MKGEINMLDNFLYIWFFLTFILNISIFVNTIRIKFEKKSEMYLFVNTLFSCIYLTLSSIFLQNVGLEILIYYAMVGVSIFFCIISFFIRLRKKARVNTRKKMKYITITYCLIPLVFYSILLLTDFIAINHASNGIVLTCEEGEFLNTHYYNYVITDQSVQKLYTGFVNTWNEKLEYVPYEICERNSEKTSDIPTSILEKMREENMEENTVTIYKYDTYYFLHVQSENFIYHGNDYLGKVKDEISEVKKIK